VIRGGSIALVASTVVMVVGLGCQEPPPPLPSALLVVDTDLDLPRTVSRLRMDVYAADGTWLHSRDVPRISESDWPASFGIVSPDESKDVSVLVRLRAYPDGASRDYRGERFTARPAAPARLQIAETLNELCGALEELPPFVEKTMRRGVKRLTEDGCYDFNEFDYEWQGTGHVGARITIDRPGTYRFEVTRSVPTDAVDTTLYLRRDCMNARSEIGCENDIDFDGGNFLSRLVLDLQPGSYTLLTGGIARQPADLTLRWTPAAEWGPDRPPPAVAPVQRQPVDASVPRLMRDGVDVTPATEPSPPATIDRIVRLDLQPGKTGHARVTLRGACAGTMSDLPAVGDTKIAPDRVRTCEEDPLVFAAPRPTAIIPTTTDAPSIGGTMIAEPCTPEDSDDQVVCVPGGTYVFGGREFSGFDSAGLISAVPLRIAAIHRFWIDRREVTVGRYREALAKGFEDEATRPVKDNASAFSETSTNGLATFTPEKGSRERVPINMLPWARARAFCNFAGGDLPSEAQWEYAAVAAGRPLKVTFPWGEDPPACGQGVFQRGAFFGNGKCPGTGPAAVDDASVALDVNALGIEGMGGNLAEYVLDAASRLDGPCWTALGPIDPVCLEEQAVYRVLRGSSWRRLATMARAVTRLETNADSFNADGGVRCAYREPPARRWSVP
jgi:formylglycine-generating enzyme required for sulfatase activity